MKNRYQPTQEYLQETFYYDDGYLYYKKNNKRWGRLDHNYFRGVLERRKLSVHIAIWIYHNGHVGEDMVIDHINGLSTDNRIENLMLKTKSQNNLSARTRGYYKERNSYVIKMTMDDGSKIYRRTKTEEEAKAIVKLYRGQRDSIYQNPTIEQFSKHISVIIEKELSRYLKGHS